ncbi:MAG: preprotein translocase subunit SecG [Candidatus Komeilibacteria bacterium]|nr:preprotein translocase subunit SecG [Candidatus Komeilibacteria bacterium]
MKQLLYWVQAIASILLILAILFQNRGSGLGSVFGGSGNVYRTKRGAEQVIFISTIVLAIIFCVSAIVSIFVS